VTLPPMPIERWLDGQSQSRCWLATVGGGGVYGVEGFRRPPFGGTEVAPSRLDTCFVCSPSLSINIYGKFAESASRPN
jgi:hypothetical protein